MSSVKEDISGSVKIDSLALEQVFKFSLLVCGYGRIRVDKPKVDIFKVGVAITRFTTVFPVHLEK